MRASLQSFPCCQSDFLYHNCRLPDSSSHRLQSENDLPLCEHAPFVLYNAFHRIRLQEMRPFHHSFHRPFRQKLPSPEAPTVSCSRFEYGSFPDSVRSEILRSTRNYLHYYYVSFRYDTYMHI